jgi:hypothetical protein
MLIRFYETIENTSTLSKSCATLASIKDEIGTSLRSPSNFALTSGDGGREPNLIYVCAS